MDKIVVEGGQPLSGRIPISGAKNAALPILVSTLLAPGEHRLTNIPRLADISSTLSLLGRIGCPSLTEADHERTFSQTARIDSSRISYSEAPYDLVRKMRASVLVLGPLLAREGQAKVSLPGGCAIGVRPIDQHLKGLEALGCEFELTGGYIHGRVKSLKGAEIHLDMPTVTGTENILMAAVLADGITTIHNAASEPEVVNLADHLISMGARIKGAGTPVIEVDGVPGLRPARQPFAIMSDRIEAGTYALAPAMAGGQVRIEHAPVKELMVLLNLMREAGLDVSYGDDWVEVKKTQPLKAVSVTTEPHPGFPTDMQAQWMAAMTIASGQSELTETIFENRFMHVPELIRMGAQIDVNGRSAVVTGVNNLSGATVMATDLRASASLVLAGLAATSQTQVLRVYHLDRGYDGLVDKLRGVGARIGRFADYIDVPEGSL